MIVNHLLYLVLYIFGGLFIALGITYDHSGPVWCGVMITVCSVITHIMLQVAESREHTRALRQAHERAVTRSQTKYPSSLDKHLIP